MKILVVDDSMTMRRIIGNVIQQLGVSKDDYKEAGDGLIAWNIFKNPSNHFDIILTDQNMPNMTGMDLVEKVRRDPISPNNKIPIIMITTEGGKPEVINALKAGVNNYIVKPFDAKTLKEKLDGIIK